MSALRPCLADSVTIDGAHTVLQRGRRNLARRIAAGNAEVRPCQPRRTADDLAALRLAQLRKALLRLVPIAEHRVVAVDRFGHMHRFRDRERPARWAQGPGAVHGLYANDEL